MTVEELIKKLKQIPQDAAVMHSINDCYEFRDVPATNINYIEEDNEVYLWIGECEKDM